MFRGNLPLFRQRGVGVKSFVIICFRKVFCVGIGMFLSDKSKSNFSMFSDEVKSQALTTSQVRNDGGSLESHSAAVQRFHRQSGYP